MNRRKQNAHRGYRERDLRRRKKAAQGQPVFPPKEGEKMNERNTNILVGCAVSVALIGLCLVLAFGGWFIAGRPGLTAANPSTPAPQVVEKVVVVTVQVPAAAPTQAPAVTEAPVVVPTEAPAPVEEVAADPQVSCERIEVFKDGQWQDAGEYLKTESTQDIGDRGVWTSRRTVVQAKAWNEALTDAELLLVETTWIKVRFNACESIPVVFAGGVRVGDLEFNDGALLKLKPGQNEIEIRNGELILWADTEHQIKDIQGTDGLEENEEGRLIHEIRNGNFDIKSRLGLAVTDSLKRYLPKDILEGVQIVLLP